MQQSRADTCKLRYNTSTVLQLSAISRHIEPPGAVLFSTEDMLLQLNQSDSQATNAQTPVKHPKLTKKLLTKDTNTVVLSTVPQQTFSDSIPASKPLPLPYRESQPQDNTIPLDEPAPPGQVQVQRRPDDQSITFEQFQQFQKQQQQMQQQDQQPQLPIQQIYRYPSDRRRPVKVYDVDQEAAEDYDSYLNLMENPNKDPLVTRSRYAVNRDVRSQAMDGGE